MKHTAIKVLALSVVCAVGWQIGGMISAHTITIFGGFIFGAFVGIPVMLILATKLRNQRIDVYHHEAAQKPVEAQKPVQPLLIPETRYTVLSSRAALPAVAQKQLEVRR